MEFTNTETDTTFIKFNHPLGASFVVVNTTLVKSNLEIIRWKIDLIQKIDHPEPKCTFTQLIINFVNQVDDDPQLILCVFSLKHEPILPYQRYVL